MVAPVQVIAGKAAGDEFREAVGLAGGDDEVGRLWVVKHALHRIDILGGPAPVARQIERAEFEHGQFSLCHVGRTAHDLLRDEPGGAKRRFVVEQDARASEQPVGLAVVGHRPERCRLADSIRTAGTELRHLVRWPLPRIAETFARGGVVEAGIQRQESHRLQHVDRTVHDAVDGLDGLVERQTHRRLR